MTRDLPVIVIGAGPQGLAAAAHLVERDLPVLVLEAGDTAASAVAQWGHVRLFSAWPELVDAAAARLLAPTGWAAPASGYPTGAEWRAEYLVPLAAALADRVRYGARVTGVSRQGRDRLVDAGRADASFTVHVTGADGSEERLAARAVIDASGTWGSPRPAGADGLPAWGERAAGEVISYRIPDPDAAAALAGKRVLVVGAGHSALGAVLTLAGPSVGARVTWAVRRAAVAGALGGGTADALPARGALGLQVKRLVEQGVVDVSTGFRVERVERDDAGVQLVAEDGRALAADHVVVLTGFTPDLSFLSELRLELDPVLQAPIRVAAEVDPNHHSCGDVKATGAADLSHPEPDFYIAGAKSYGRAPTFLALTGYEQVRSIAAALAGDHQAAARIELTLPETGVCGGAGDFDPTGASSSGSCCAPAAPQVISLGRRSLLTEVDA